jgi:LysM repeat protein
MNNSNPFVPKGSLLEQQCKRRSRMKLAVLCVLVVGAASLMGMLIQGCKREQVETVNIPPPAETNTVVADTNPPSMVASNPPVAPPPVVAPAPAPAPAPEAAGTEYVVVKGDSFAKIARKNGVSVKAIEAANPGVAPTKLKVGQKLSIPASSGGAAASSSAGAQPSTGSSTGEEAYTVKSGDTLTKIAKSHGTTVKAIRAENSLNTDHIKVGQKLKIPAKAEAAAPAPAPAPAPVAPAFTPAAASSRTPAPAPAGTPGQ